MSVAVLTEIKLSSGKQMEVETFIGNANGKRFPGVRLKVGGKKLKKIVASMPARRALELVAALEAAFNESHGRVPADGFYASRAWESVRYDVLKRDGFRCQLCGATGDRAQLHVDHVRPRSKYPDLELEPDNLRTACRACNLGKGAKDE